GSSATRARRGARLSQFFGDDLVAEIDALVADPHVGPGDDFVDLRRRLAAEGAVPPARILGLRPPPPQPVPPAAGQRAREQADHFLADSLPRQAETACQDLGADSLAFPDQSEHQMLGTDVVVAKMEGFAER